MNIAVNPYTNLAHLIPQANAMNLTGLALSTEQISDDNDVCPALPWIDITHTAKNPLARLVQQTQRFQVELPAQLLSSSKSLDNKPQEISLAQQQGPSRNALRNAGRRAQTGPTPPPENKSGEYKSFFRLADQLKTMSLANVARLTPKTRNFLVIIYEATNFSEARGRLGALQIAFPDFDTALYQKIKDAAQNKLRASIGDIACDISTITTTHNNKPSGWFQIRKLRALKDTIGLFKTLSLCCLDQKITPHIHALLQRAKNLLVLQLTEILDTDPPSDDELKAIKNKAPEFLYYLNLCETALGYLALKLEFELITIDTQTNGLITHTLEHLVTQQQRLCAFFDLRIPAPKTTDHVTQTATAPQPLKFPLSPEQEIIRLVRIYRLGPRRIASFRRFAEIYYTLHRDNSFFLQVMELYHKLTGTDSQYALLQLITYSNHAEAVQRIQLAIQTMNQYSHDFEDLDSFVKHYCVEETRTDRKNGNGFHFELRTLLTLSRFPAIKVLQIGARFNGHEVDIIIEHQDKTYIIECKRGISEEHAQKTQDQIQKHLQLCATHGYGYIYIMLNKNRLPESVRDFLTQKNIPLITSEELITMTPEELDQIITGNHNK